LPGRCVIWSILALSVCAVGARAGRWRPGTELPFRDLRPSNWVLAVILAISIV
jgi:hypothetical protein